MTTSCVFVLAGICSPLLTGGFGSRFLLIDHSDHPCECLHLLALTRIPLGLQPSIGRGHKQSRIRGISVRHLRLRQWPAVAMENGRASRDALHMNARSSLVPKPSTAGVSLSKVLSLDPFLHFFVLAGICGPLLVGGFGSRFLLINHPDHPSECLQMLALARFPPGLQPSIGRGHKQSRIRGISIHHSCLQRQPALAMEDGGASMESG